MKIAIRVCNWIGDVVMNLPAIEFLRSQYPEAELVAIARPWVAELLGFRTDLISRVLPFDDKKAGLSDLMAFGRTLRAERFDISVVFTKHIKGVVPPFLARIPRRVGFASTETRLFINGGMPFHRLPKSGRHQSLNYLDLVARGLALPESGELVKPRLLPDALLGQEVQKKFLAGCPQPWLMIHAGAAYGTAKRWTAEGYGEVASGFLERHGGTVVLLGVPSEAEVNERILRGAGAERVRNLVGATSLRESLALISLSQAFLSNDSGLMHAAAAFERAQVAIFGPTDLEATFPLNENARTLRHEVHCSPCFKRDCPFGHECMNGVAATEVSAALEAVFSSPVEQS